MRDELTFNAEDNDAAPDEPILLQKESDSIIINQSHSIIKFLSGSIE